MECQLEKPCGVTASHMTAPSGKHARNQDYLNHHDGYYDITLKMFPTFSSLLISSLTVSTCFQQGKIA